MVTNNVTDSVQRTLSQAQWHMIAMLPTSGALSLENSKANRTTPQKKNYLYHQLKIIHLSLHASLHKHLFNTSLLENHCARNRHNKKLEHQTERGKLNFQSKTRNASLTFLQL